MLRRRPLAVALALVLVRTWGTYVADDILLGSQLPSLLLTFYLLAISAALFSGTYTALDFRSSIGGGAG